MSEDLKKEYQRGYSKGYQAGKRNVAKSRSYEHERRERQAFYDRAFLAALPFAMEQEGWTRGNKKINTLEDRIRLASETAHDALKQRKYIV